MIIKKLLLSVLVLSAFAANAGAQENYEPVEDHLSHLSIREKIAQLLIVPFYQTGEANQLLLDKLVTKVGVGGIIILSDHNSVDWTTKRIKELQAESELPLLVTIDGEWGAAMRFQEEFKPFPRQKQLADSPLDSIRLVGYNIGKELRKLGILVNYAPVVDLAMNSTAAVGTRSFGTDPNKVAEQGVAIMKGMQEGGVFTCAKHFPGHGATTTDSHYSISLVPNSREDLDTTHIVPFRRMIEEGVDMVMVGHLSVPSLDSTGTPASISKPIVTGLLRNEMGFKGAIVTDALGMKGLTKANTSGVNNAVAAYRAGVDFMLCPKDVDEVVNTLEQDIKSGISSEEELDSRVRKMLEMKKRAGLLHPWMSHDTLSFQGLKREYYMFVPDNLLPGKPLIVMLHGYGGSAKGYRPEMIEAARRHGFAVCVPMGYKDLNGKKSWNVKYTRQKGMASNDEAFVNALVDIVAKRYDLNAGNAFLVGMSNGGEMCYIFSHKYPKRFRAISSISGLYMNWLKDEKGAAGKVPFMEIHGTADKTSLWEGDLEDKGGWGAYLGVDEAIERVVRKNRLKFKEEVKLPLLRNTDDPKGGSREVIMYRYEGRKGLWSKAEPCEVRLYKVMGGKHSWHLSDIDSCEETINFFTKYLID